MLIQSITSMIITTPQLSNRQLSRSRSDEKLGTRALGRTTFILSENAHQHHWAGEGCLSIKAFFNGRALYNVGRGCHAVDDSCYLLLNDQQRYSITIDSPTPVESFSIFFERGFADEVSRSYSATSALLLEEPEFGPVPACDFVERTYPHDAILSPILFRLRRRLATSQPEPLWLEEQLHAVAERLLKVHQKERRQMALLSAARAATREELYRRVHRARDYADALFHERVSLRGLAQVACLSPNHFLRAFRQAFGQTPHQYLSTRRLWQAAHLLKGTDQPVTDICLAVGFESLGSFSSLFRRRFGISPQGFRRQKGDFREAVAAASV
jgi:AraC family transcriptional regulator